MRRRNNFFCVRILWTSILFFHITICPIYRHEIEKISSLRRAVPDNAAVDILRTCKFQIDIVSDQWSVCEEWREYISPFDRISRPCRHCCMPNFDVFCTVFSYNYTVFRGYYNNKYQIEYQSISSTLHEESMKRHSTWGVAPKSSQSENRHSEWNNSLFYKHKVDIREMKRLRLRDLIIQIYLLSCLGINFLNVSENVF